jgi:hypothetical protein
LTSPRTTVCSARTTSGSDKGSAETALFAAGCMLSCGLGEFFVAFAVDEQLGSDKITAIERAKSNVELRIQEAKPLSGPGYR